MLFEYPVLLSFNCCQLHKLVKGVLWKYSNAGFHECLLIPTALCNKICGKNYRFIADCSSKVPDDKTFVITQIPVNSQLRLSGNLSGRGRKQIKCIDSTKAHIYWFHTNCIHHHLYSRMLFIYTTRVSSTGLESETLGSISAMTASEKGNKLCHKYMHFFHKLCTW